MNDADAGVFGVARVGEAHGLAAQPKLSLGRVDHAGQDFHQRALARSVFATNGVQLARGDVQRNLAQRHHTGKALGDAADRDQCAALSGNGGTVGHAE